MKRIMKTVTAGLMAAVLVVGLAACGTGAKNESGKQLYHIMRVNEIRIAIVFKL